MIVQVNGIDLFCEIVGKGRPLLMIHGNGEDHTIFDEAVQCLKDEFACYLIDSRGHGQSTPVEQLHYSDMADDLVLLMEKLDLKEVVFYGFSDGGIVGLLAAMKTERIRTLSGSNAHFSLKRAELS